MTHDSWFITKTPTLLAGESPTVIQLPDLVLPAGLQEDTLDALGRHQDEGIGKSVSAFWNRLVSHLPNNAATDCQVVYDIFTSKLPAMIQQTRFRCQADV